MNIVGYHITNNYIVNSNGQIKTEAPWLSFLLENLGHDCIKILYHMDYSVACLLKMINIPEDAMRELAENTDLMFDDYKFEYIPGIWFSIKDYLSKQWAGFSDANQYSNLLPSVLINHEYELAFEAKAIGEKVYQALWRQGLNPKTLTSPISVYNKQVLSEIDLPTWRNMDMPEEAAWYAYKCCQSPWIEAFQTGHWDETWDYDIQSAYGSELAELIDTRYGEWQKSNCMNTQAIYGYYLCNANITTHFSPLIINNFTPTGEVPQVYLTKAKAKFIRDCGIGDIKIIDGWEWTPKVQAFDNLTAFKTKHNFRPLEKIVNRLYTNKLNAQDEFEDNIVKRIMSGIWGKTLEQHEKGFGDNFNPCWGAEVENNIQLKVAAAVIANQAQDKLISITVDGLLTNHPLHNLLVVGKAVGLGKWKLSHHCPAIVIGSGTQALRDKHSQAQFALNYDWITEQIASKPKATEYKILGTTPITLPKAIAYKRIKDLGKIENTARIIKIDSEHKRNYRIEPKNGGDLLKNKFSSIPWDASMIINKEDLCQYIPESLETV